MEECDATLMQRTNMSNTPTTNDEGNESKRSTDEPRAPHHPHDTGELASHGESKSQQALTATQKEEASVPTLKDLLSPFGGKAPPLPKGCNYHFYIVKDEAHKYAAIVIAIALRNIGFKIWLSQWQAEASRDVDEHAMQRGIREAATILLIS